MNYAVGGTAIAGRDGVVLRGRRTIPVGSAAATIIVTPIKDARMEDGETKRVAGALVQRMTFG